MVHSMLLALLMLLQSSATVPRTETGANYLMGAADSPVRIELFSDFACPSCRQFYLDTVVPLMREYSSTNRVAIIFREFPLPSHPSARIASRYALASKSAGRDQWRKVIEYLYTCQAEWSYDGKIEPVLSRILPADEVQGLKEKASDAAIERAIEHDIQLGDQKLVNSTPTIFVTIGGKEQRLTRGLPFQVLKDFIESALK